MNIVEYVNATIEKQKDTMFNSNWRPYGRYSYLDKILGISRHERRACEKKGKVTDDILEKLMGSEFLKDDENILLYLI